MKAKENPFKPTAGGEPPLLIGRGKVIRDFEKGLDNGSRCPRAHYARHRRSWNRKNRDAHCVRRPGQSAQMGCHRRNGLCRTMRTPC